MSEKEKKIGFFKDTPGLILFIIVYIVIITQIIGVYITFDYSHDSYLTYYKFYFYILCFMSIWSHYSSSVTDPGKITHDLNPTVIDFYINIREFSMRKAEAFNRKFRKLFFEKKEDEEEEPLCEEDEISSDDENEYEMVTTITDDVMESVSKEHKVKLKRCDKCCIVRVPRVHHCRVCKGCIMKMDHHCPWINNCVGQFNQKFFIQFCWYCFFGCLAAINITGYYYIYKRRKE
jgi:palmitoyltransferase